MPRLLRAQVQSRHFQSSGDLRRVNNFSSKGHTHSRRRSASPQRRRSRSEERPGQRSRRQYERRDSDRRDPDRRDNDRSDNIRHEQDFSYGTNPKALPVCAVCLGRHSHNVYNCNALRTWNSAHATTSKRTKGELRLRSNSAPLCIEWQRARGCPSTKHDAKHICSGCNQTSHGAQQCPRSQKA